MVGQQRAGCLDLISLRSFGMIHPIGHRRNLGSNVLRLRRQHVCSLNYPHDYLRCTPTDCNSERVPYHRPYPHIRSVDFTASRKGRWWPFLGSGQLPKEPLCALPARLARASDICGCATPSRSWVISAVDRATADSDVEQGHRPLCVFSPGPDRPRCGEFMPAGRFSRAALVAASGLGGSNP